MSCSLEGQATDNVQSSASATRLATYYGITPEKSGIGFWAIILLLDNYWVTSQLILSKSPEFRLNSYYLLTNKLLVSVSQEPKKVN